MKVKTLLSLFAMEGTSIATVKIEQNDYTKATYDYWDLRSRKYGFYGNATVESFTIRNTSLVITISSRPIQITGRP